MTFPRLPKENQNPRLDPNAPKAANVTAQGFVNPASTTAGQFVRDSRYSVETIAGLDYTVEVGKRYRLRSCLPVAAYPVIEVRLAAISIAGGCTISEMASGFWRDDATGRIDGEPVYVLEVTSHNKAALLAIRSRLVDLGRKAGERWLDCQLDVFEALHVETTKA